METPPGQMAVRPALKLPLRFRLHSWRASKAEGQLNHKMAQVIAGKKSSRRSRGCPCGRPALSAARTGPVVPAHSGDDQEQLDVEREFLDDALCPALRAPEGATSLS